MSLNDIALVTGARGGIGRALVARLRARGLRVAAVGRDAATLAEVLAEAASLPTPPHPRAPRRPSPPAANSSARLRRGWLMLWEAR